MGSYVPSSTVATQNTQSQTLVGSVNLCEWMKSAPICLCRMRGLEGQNNTPSPYTRKEQSCKTIHTSGLNLRMVSPSFFGNLGYLGLSGCSQGHSCWVSSHLKNSKKGKKSKERKGDRNQITSNLPPAGSGLKWPSQGKRRWRSLSSSVISLSKATLAQNVCHSLFFLSSLQNFLEEKKGSQDPIPIQTSCRLGGQ